MTAFKSGDPLSLNRLYGRSSGHKLRKGQQELVDTLLPQIEVPAEGEITSRRLFGDERPLHLEIGFGSGEHLADRAEKHLANVRLWRGDALEVLQRVPDGALSFLYLLHPDPWPKARHAKRRMINDRPVALFAAKLKPGGELRLATDDPTYLTWALMVMQRNSGEFEWLAERPRDFLEPPGGWIETRYGAKSRREGRRPYYLRYRRTS
jgi:tRNA (guanine-N7-)-methyltransferase